MHTLAGAREAAPLTAAVPDGLRIPSESAIIRPRRRAHQDARTCRTAELKRDLSNHHHE
jgi:hypothetical protein